MALSIIVVHVFAVQAVPIVLKFDDMGSQAERAKAVAAVIHEQKYIYSNPEVSHQSGILLFYFSQLVVLCQARRGALQSELIL